MVVLDQLPDLVLDTIFECLAEVDLSCSSIFALSSASRNLNHAGARIRLRNIVLDLQPEGKAWQDVARMSEILSTPNASRHVRQVKITGRSTTTQQNINENLAQSKAVWQALVEFISLCTGLSDFVWAAREKLPRCILDGLHEHPFGPRLHLSAFDQCVMVKGRELQDIGSYGYALATSPSLYGFESTHHSGGTRRHHDCVPENLLKVVAGLAPNLREVSVFYDDTEVPQDVLKHQIPCQRWKTALKNRQLEPAQGRGNLTKLKLKGRTVTTSRVRDWWISTNFSTLRTLSLGSNIGDSYIEHEAFTSLVDIAAQGFLSQISKLSFHSLIVGGWNLRSLNPIAELLVHLSSLGALTVTSMLSGMFCDDFTYNNTSLSRLHLGDSSSSCNPYSISRPDLQTIRKNCPNIQDLRILITRAKDEMDIRLSPTLREEDVRLYQTLGSFSHLKILELTFILDILGRLDGMSSDAQIDSTMSALRRGAMDEKLAKEVFRVILDTNRSSRPGTTPTFTYLKIHHHDQQIWRRIFQKMQKLKFRSCILERQYADSQSNEVHYTGIAHENHGDMYELVKEKCEAGYKDEIEDCELYLKAWKLVWPTPAGAHWLDHWHSIPLFLSTNSDRT